MKAHFPRPSLGIVVGSETHNFSKHSGMSRRFCFLLFAFTFASFVPAGLDFQAELHSTAGQLSPLPAALCPYASKNNWTKLFIRSQGGCTPTSQTQMMAGRSETAPGWDCNGHLRGWMHTAVTHNQRGQIGWASTYGQTQQLTASLFNAWLLINIHHESACFHLVQIIIFQIILYYNQYQH